MVKDSGIILEIQRMSTEDGPGIRTTVFFKGCSLSCAWCHNPESISLKPQIHWIGSRCIGCRTCLKTCTLKALSLDEHGMRIDRAVCTGCGDCAEACPSTAMELLGHAWDLEALVTEVIKDTAYFEASQGGITISGGEPTMQTPFAAAFLARLKAAGIHTALDTCGQCPQKSLETLLPLTDMVLFDIKLIDPQTHLAFTGNTNELILANLKQVAAHLQKKGGTLWIRTPIIPRVTDTPENMRAIGAFIAHNLDGCAQRWELCAFNNLCRDKYRRLDKDWAFKDCELIPKPRMEELAAVAKSSGVDQGIVHWSGATRL